MIIVLPAIKDTYVTNLKTQSVDSITSNVGRASTLDLFKLYNENKNANSSAVLAFDINGTVANADEEFTLIDSLGNIVTFITKTDVVTRDGSTDVNNKVIIGLQATTITDYAGIFSTVINNVTGNENGLTLNITAFSNSNNELMLKQDNPGASGDTIITLPGDPVDYVSVTSNDSNTFSRKETSAILLDFDITGFKDEFMSNVVFADSAFKDLTAELILHDVSTGQTKPRNYTLSAYNLKKDFEEGIGKDTIHFSDLGEVANFTNLNSNSSSNSFEIPGYVSSIDDISILDEIDGSESTPTCLIERGDENAIFDITGYFKDQVENAINNKGILITFDDASINNEKTYFVKRFGSRHLLNKSLVPMLKISIPDYSYSIPKKTQFAKRYLDNEETFFLFNRNTLLSDFKSPDGAVLKARVISEDKNTIYLNNIATSNVTNYKGKVVSGIKKAIISDTSISRFASSISSNIKDDKLVTFLRWYWDDDAPDEDFIVKEEKIVFNVSETTNDKTYSNLVSSVKFENTKLSSDNTISIGHVYFLDARASLSIVKVPFDILSENLGEVKYQVINIENNKVLYDYGDATKLFYDGEKYVFNFCLPNIFKNTRIRFNFKVENQINDSVYIIKNKEDFRVE